jgi:PEP-CTERM motif
MVMDERIQQKAAGFLQQRGMLPVLAWLSAALMLLPGWASAYSLSIEPTSQTVGLGTEVAVTVKVSNTQPSGLGAYDFRFNFDGAVLAFDRFSDAAGLGAAVGLGVTQLGNSLLVSDFSLETVPDLLSFQSADFTLFTLVFDTVGLGTSLLDLSNISVFDAGGNMVAATSGGGSITVQASSGVPEPASWALVGLAMAAGLSWRKKAPRPG